MSIYEKQENRQKKKPYKYLKYFPGEAFAYNKNDEIIGTVDPDGEFRPIKGRKVPRGEKVRR